MESFMGDLSACETMIMKVIWDAKEDIALQDLIRELADRYKKNYARTTVVTFVHKIVDKGFATTYRKGKAAYIHPEKIDQTFSSSNSVSFEINSSMIPRIDFIITIQ